MSEHWSAALHAIVEEHRFGLTFDSQAAVALQACGHDLPVYSFDRLGGPNAASSHLRFALSHQPYP